MSGLRTMTVSLGKEFENKQETDFILEKTSRKSGFHETYRNREKWREREFCGH